MTTSSKSKSYIKSKRSSKNVKLSKNLLKKALKTGRGVYANKLVSFLAENIISHNTTIEIALTALLPKEIAYVMITTLRSWSDLKTYSERVVLDNLLLPITSYIIFSLPKINFSTIESCIILLGKLLIVIAILKHQPKRYIIKLRKDLSI